MFQLLFLLLHRRRLAKLERLQNLAAALDELLITRRLTPATRHQLQERRQLLEDDIRRLRAS